jgi:predicted short-subunit dehydrogenase-like oxidoreductase (DUF2520 family)
VTDIPGIFVLGAGRAGRSLARALADSGVIINGLHGRHTEQGVVTAGQIPASISDAGAVLVAVRDSQLPAAFLELSRAPLAPGTIILHLSGSGDPEGLDDIRARGHPAGTFHPLLPLADPSAATRLLRTAWIGVDGDTAAIELSGRLARALGARIMRIPPGEKARYHAAAVFAANFPVILSALAADLLRNAGVAGDESWPAVVALMQAAAANIQTAAPEGALTGPLRRGDAGTVALHLKALRDDPPTLAAYVALSRAAIPLARRAGTDPIALDEIERELEQGMNQLATLSDTIRT